MDPLHVIDFMAITQDFVFIILISTTSSTSVIGNGSNHNNGGAGASNNGGGGTSTHMPVTAPHIGKRQAPAPPGGGPAAGGVSLSTSASQDIQKYNKIFRFFYVLKIFRYFSSLKILAYAMAEGWKALRIKLNFKIYIFICKLL